MFLHARSRHRAGSTLTGHTILVTAGLILVVACRRRRVIRVVLGAALGGGKLGPRAGLLSSHRVWRGPVHFQTIWSSSFDSSDVFLVPTLFGSAHGDLKGLFTSTVTAGRHGDFRSLIHGLLHGGSCAWEGKERKSD